MSAGEETQRDENPRTDSDTPSRHAQPEHNHLWHYARAEECLAAAAAADETVSSGDMRRWSYMERAQGHIALGDSLRDTLGFRVPRDD